MFYWLLMFGLWVTGLVVWLVYGWVRWLPVSDGGGFPGVASVPAFLDWFVLFVIYLFLWYFDYYFGLYWLCGFVCLWCLVWWVVLLYVVFVWLLVDCLVWVRVVVLDCLLVFALLCGFGFLLFWGWAYVCLVSGILCDWLFLLSKFFHYYYFALLGVLPFWGGLWDRVFRGWFSGFWVRWILIVSLFSRQFRDG